jgi:hypothetical protein
MRCEMAKRLARALVCVVSTASPCWAVNPGFIPGDACFHSVLTENYLGTFRPTSGVLKLHYMYPEPMMLCGYGGFAHLTITHCPPSLYAGLEKVYRAARKLDPKLVRVLEGAAGKENVELNGLNLFVCNKNADWKTQVIGLKYNEHWFDFPIKSPRPPSGWMTTGNNSERMNTEAYRYVSFLTGADAVIEDWRNSARIPGLKVQLPDVKGWEFAGPEIAEPVVVNAEDIELVVTCAPLDDYFRQKDGARFYVIRSTGVRELQWQLSGNGTRIELTDKPLGSK